MISGLIFGLHKIAKKIFEESGEEGAGEESMRYIQLFVNLFC